MSDQWLLTPDHVHQWMNEAAQQLTQVRDALNRANVFPVADADTGTNMAVTISHAARAAQAATRTQPHIEANALLSEVARAAMHSARGNSGAILAQWLNGFAHGHAQAGVPAACVEGADSAYRAVADPVDGTVLTVAHAVARAASTGDTTTDAATRIDNLAEVAYTSFLATNTQLHALADHGVRDAGACGFVLIIQALATTILGHHHTNGRPNPQDFLLVTPPAPDHPNRPHTTTDTTTAGYEVTALLTWNKPLSPTQRSGIERRLKDAGDSLVLGRGVSPNDSVPFHIHTDHPERVLNICADVADQVSHIALRSLTPPHTPDAPQPVVVLRTPVFARELARTGALVILTGTHHITTEELTALLDDTHTSNLHITNRATHPQTAAAFPHATPHPNDIALATHLTHHAWAIDPNDTPPTTHLTLTRDDNPITAITNALNTLTDTAPQTATNGTTTITMLTDTHYPAHHISALTHHLITLHPTPPHLTVIPAHTAGTTADITLTRHH